uniref:Uncharacterized protein n=1 Tax=Trichobilharzia regenti TaxID=157069 RepID=A0AA85KLD5_TRIRE|nr:unnamed protein product [Trichobilharzia regenti]
MTSSLGHSTYIQTQFLASSLFLFSDGGRRFLKDVLQDMAYMFFLTTKSRDAMRQYYRISHPACFIHQTLCGVTAKMFYLFDENANNHQDVTKQLPLLSNDHPDEVDVDKATIDTRQCSIQEDKQRTVFGMVKVLDIHIENIKNRTRSFRLKYQPKEGTQIINYLRNLQTLQKLFPTAELEAQNPDQICARTRCACLVRIYKKLMKLNQHLRHLWNTGLKVLIE